MSFRKTGSSSSRRNRKPLNQGKFDPSEDKQIFDLVAQHGEDFEIIASIMSTRNARQLKERWRDHLCPTINSAPFDREEDELLMETYEEMGAKWVKMIPFFQNRTASMLKNRYQLLERRLRKGKEIIYEKEHQSPLPDDIKCEVQVERKVQLPEKYNFMSMNYNEMMEFWNDIYSISSDQAADIPIADFYNFF